MYDSLGRAVKQYVGFDTDETAYGDASSVADDTILEQTETTYDAAGSVILSTTRRRFHNATGDGELTSPDGSQPKARVSYVVFYADPVGRSIATANYGTNGGSSLTRSDTVPTRSDDVLVSSTEYDSTGQAYKTTDPAGKEDRQEFDDAGRVLKTIQNYQDGVVNGDYPDEDVTVEMTYNADGQILTLTAKNPTTGDQITRYVYGTTLDDSAVARADLLRAEIYPDSDDTTDPLGNGSDGVYDRVEYSYNRQSERIEKTDQNGTVHVYGFDALGRMIHDRVTWVGSGIDNAVRRISTTYEVRGMVASLTSYDDSTVGSGNALNQVAFEYNDLGALVKNYQEHDGEKTAATPYVGYNFDTTASGGQFTKGARPTSIRYPNGRLVHFDYGTSGSMADAMSRIAAIQDDDSGSPGSSLA
ncbi:MAG TPA: hypothetical protein PK373_05155, partial [Sedimentisphaerales bacterium]|nr:hypothetical protein [Sedimentisphaerales bacterium]